MRLILLLALSTSVALPALSQPTVGVRASGVYSTAAAHPDDVSFSISLGEAVGVGVGLFAEVPVTPTLSVVADVGYVQGGAGDDTPRTTVPSPEPTGDTDEFLIRTHALSLAPALAATLRSEDIEPFLFLGPRIDIKVSERTEVEGESRTSDDFPDTAFGLAGGAGIAKGRGRLDLRASYLWGVDSPIRQSAFELRLGVTL